MSWYEKNTLTELTKILEEAPSGAFDGLLREVEMLAAAEVAAEEARDLRVLVRRREAELGKARWLAARFDGPRGAWALAEARRLREELAGLRKELHFVTNVAEWREPALRRIEKIRRGIEAGFFRTPGDCRRIRQARAEEGRGVSAYAENARRALEEAAEEADLLQEAWEAARAEGRLDWALWRARKAAKAEAEAARAQLRGWGKPRTRRARVEGENFLLGEGVEEVDPERVRVQARIETSCCGQVAQYEVSDGGARRRGVSGCHPRGTRQDRVKRGRRQERRFREAVREEMAHRALLRQDGWDEPHGENLVAAQNWVPPMN